MKSSNIRQESLLGSDKVIIGNQFTDLVLETLGKVYVKTGNRLDLLDTLIGTLMSTNSTQAIIVQSQLELENLQYPGDGKFIFNKVNNALYFSLDKRYILVTELKDEQFSGYVKKTGDLMSGPLEISTVEAPLIIASSALVKNLNTQYLNGRSSEEFAKSREKETIYGDWTFTGQNIAENNWQFKENVRFIKDIVTSGNISSPEFASGFGGYGWRLDADTNTLTIDNLVVRKVMHVYEMVINQISATNGSLWVSNSVKCENAYTVKILLKEDLELKSKEDLIKYIKNETYYIVTESNLDGLSINRDINDYTDTDIGAVTETQSLSNATTINNNIKQFINYKYLIYIKDYNKLASSEHFNPQMLYNEEQLNNIQDTDISSNLTLYYIYKQNKVLKWDSSGLKPEITKPISTFNKDFQFYTIIDNQKIGIKPYYKYYALQKNKMQTAVDQRISTKNLDMAVPNLYIIDTENQKTPTLKAGDFVRCQKYQDNNIKYYDAIVTAQIKSHTYILQKADSVLDQYTEISYGDNGAIIQRQDKENTIAYNQTTTYFNPNTGETITNIDEDYSKLTNITKDDDIIQIGNISDTNRQNAIYITSTDDQSPYIDVISGLNRPDYSVIYYYPLFKQIKVGLKRKGDIFIKGEFDNYYCQKQKVNIISLPSILGTSEKNPIVYVELVDKKYYRVYINNGKINEIPSDTSNGYFITSYPTIQSIVEQENGQLKQISSRITKVRLGKLDGIYNDIFKNAQPYGYGLYGENVFLTGEFYLSNGKSVVEFTKEQIKFEMKDEIQETINSIPFGTRNLLKDSGDKVTITGSDYLIKTYKSTIQFKPEQKYTIVIKGSTSIGQSFGLWVNGPRDYLGEFPQNMTGQVEYIHITIPSYIEEIPESTISVYNKPDPQGINKPCEIEWIAMYSDHIKPPLDWTPASEDLVTKIERNSSQIEQLPDKITLSVSKDITGGNLNYISGTQGVTEVEGKGGPNECFSKWVIHKEASEKTIGSAWKVKFENCTFGPNANCLIQIVGDEWQWLGFNNVSPNANTEYLVFVQQRKMPKVAHDASVQVRLDDITGKVYISEFRVYKLLLDEKGNIPTSPLPWYLSKWDTEVLDSKITQTAEEINLNVTKQINDTKNYFSSEISQTADNISMKINQVIAGENLLAGGGFLTDDGLHGWKQQGNIDLDIVYNKDLLGTEKCLYVYIMGERTGFWRPLTDKSASILRNGMTYTVSFDIFRAPKFADPDKITLGIDEGDYTQSIDISGIPLGQWQRVSFTRTITNLKVQAFGMYFSYNNQHGCVYIKKIKLELGTQSTPWSKHDNDSLLASGIDVLNEKIVLTSDKTIIQDKKGTQIAMFTSDKDGNTLINSECIDTNKLIAQQVTTKPSAENQNAHIEIVGSEIKIFGPKAMNMWIGVDSDNFIALKYFDDEGTLLYQLGKSGLVTKPSRPEGFFTRWLYKIGNSLEEAFRDGKYIDWIYSVNNRVYLYNCEIKEGIYMDPGNDGKIFKLESVTSDSISGIYIDAPSYQGAPHSNRNEILRLDPDPTKPFTVGVHPLNPPVYNSRPLYYVKMYSYYQGKVQKTYNAYFNG